MSRRWTGALRFQKCERGTTLVELLVVIIIMSIVSTMIIGTWFTLSKSYASTTESSEQRDDAQLAMERLVRELRDVQDAPPGSGVTDINKPAINSTNMGPYRVRVNTAFNAADADSPDSVPNLVEFRLQNGVLTRQMAGPDRLFGTADDRLLTLAENVVNSQQGVDLFRYYYYGGAGDLVHSSGTSGLPTANTNRIKAIKVSLLIDLNPGRSPEYMKIENMVQPRNLRNF